jgi:HlyD family secretion protein
VVYYQVVVTPQQAEGRKTLTVPVKRESLSITVSANGTISSERSINLSPKSSGVLKRLLVKEGDAVKKGQVVAYMDDSNLRGQLMQAQGNLEADQANLRKLINGSRVEDIAKAQAELDEDQANLQELINGNRIEDIAQAQARLRSAQASLDKAEDDFRRNETLYQDGAISLQTLNQKRSDRDSAQADVQEKQEALALQKVGTRPEEIAQARARLNQKQHALALLKAGTRPEEIDQARAEVMATQGSLQNIQAQINDTVLRAPFDGVVTKKYSDPGAFVTPTTAGSNVSGAASNSIVSLASTNQVVANLSEISIAQIQLGQNVTIQADAYPRKTFAGRVIQIAAEATVTQNVTSFEVKVAILSDPDKLLRSGMNVEAEFQVGQLNNAIVVPNVAVVQQQGVTGVFVTGTNNQPVFTPIQTGATVNNKTEVKSGLKGTERVLISFPPGSRPQSNLPGLPLGGSSSKGGNPSGGGSPGTEPPI